MKRTIRVLALSLSILAAFAAVLIVAGVILLDWAKGQLAANGLGAVDFTVAELSLDRLSLSDIRFGLGREQGLERFTVFFRPTRLLRDRSLDKILVEGAELRFIPGDDGVPRLAGVSLPETPGDKAGLKMPALPIAGIELRASRLSLETDLGALRIPLRGTLTQADLGAWALDARLELHYWESHGQEARGELALRGRQEQDGATQLEVTLSGTEGWLPDGLDTLGAGQATLEWDGGEQLSGTGSLAVHLAGSPMMLAVQADKTQDKGLTFALSLNASDLDLAVLDERAGLGAGLAGRVSLQTRIEGALPVLSEHWLEEASADGRISLRIKDGALLGLAAGAVGDIALEVRADKTQGKALAFAMNLNTSDLDLAVLDELAGSGAGLTGRVSLQTRLQGALPDLSERWLEAASADGRISLQIRDGTLPDLVAEASGAIDLDLSLSEASLLAVPASPWEVTGRLVALDPPARFRLSDVKLSDVKGHHGLRLTSSTDLARQTATGAVGFALEAPSQPKLAGTVSGRVEHALEDGLRFDLERLRLDPTGWTHDGMQIRVGALDARLAGTPSQMHGRVSTRLDVSDVTYGGDRLTGGEIELEGDLTHTDKGLALTVKDCVSVQAKHLDLGGVQWLCPVDLCIRQAKGRPLLRFDPVKKRWSLALALPSHPMVLAVKHGQDPIELAGTMPQARLSATFDPTKKALKLVLNTRGGRLELAEQAVAVSDLELALRQERATSVTLQHAIATSLASPPDFPALVLTGKAQGRLDNSMAFELIARGREVPLKLSAQGKHHFGLAIGELSYRLDKIQFSPQGLQPGDLVPAVDKLISEVRGSLALSGELSWIAGVPATHLQLALHDLGFDAPGLSVRGINMQLQHAGRTVRNQLDAQEIQIDLLDIGIPLRNGLIRFHTRETPSVHVEQLCFFWGGGGIQLEPFALRFDQLAAEHSFVLTFEAIRLNPLLQLIPLDGLWGTGFLSGRIPLRIRGSEIAVDQGSISTETPGLLRYRPEEKPGFFEYNSHTELLFEALRNFHYESLSIGLNGRTQDNLQLSISLAGANPDLYDGHPFKLNFNLEGELDTIIRRSLAIVTFAERFGEVLPRYLK